MKSAVFYLALPGVSLALAEHSFTKLALSVLLLEKVMSTGILVANYTVAFFSVFYLLTAKAIASASPKAHQKGLQATTAVSPSTTAFAPLALLIVELLAPFSQVETILVAWRSVLVLQMVRAIVEKQPRLWEHSVLLQRLVGCVLI